jgi:conjugal transfer/entry exclusion protein
MIKEKIKVNNRTYSVNEQTQMYAMRLRNLYQQSYSDVDSFDEVSSEISTTVNNLLKHALYPEVKEDDMDGVIQQVLKMFEKSSQRK